MGAQSQSNTNRLSLNSSVFAGRIKKFDTYQQRPMQQRPAQRAPIQPMQQQAQKIVSRTVPITIPRQNIEFKKVPATLVKPVSPQQIQKKRIAQKHVEQARTSQTSENISMTQTLAMQAIGQSSAKQKSVLADQFEESLYMNANKKKQEKSKLVTAMNTIAIIVFIFASAVSVQTLLTNRQTQDVLAEKTGQQGQDGQGVAEGTGRDPAEDPVSDDAIINYQVAPELPRYLKIPDIGVFARIKHTGRDAEGAVDAPKNIHDVSWYTESAKPGNAIGASLLLGHVQGWTAPGVFKNIDKLQPGARFTVEKGSGETITYEVTRGQEYTLAELNMAKILSAEEAGEHDMKLMTCAGAFDASTESYQSRYVVYAKVIR